MAKSKNTVKSGDYLNALPRGYRLEEYEFQNVLGAGGFGITYRVFDHNLGKEVAIKEYLPNDLALRQDAVEVLPKSVVDKDDFEWGLDRFLDEAKVLARFDHKNIIKVHRYFQAHGTGYIVMEYAEGDTLSDILKKNGKLSPRQLEAILFPLLDGLEEVHKMGVFHRDIKPGNIIVRNDGTPVILDFGAARQDINVKSRSVTAIVTPGYSPIEQYSTKGNQGPWTDVYALAAVSYYAITGQRPDDAAERIHEDRLAQWSAKVTGWDGCFLAAVEKALSFREEDRPQSIAEWRRALLERDESKQSSGDRRGGFTRLITLDRGGLLDRSTPIWVGSLSVIAAVVLIVLYILIPLEGVQSPEQIVTFSLPPEGMPLNSVELESIFAALAKQPVNVETLEQTQTLKSRVVAQIDTHISKDGLELANDLLDTSAKLWPKEKAFSRTGDLRKRLLGAFARENTMRQVNEIVGTAQAWLKSDQEGRSAGIREVLNNLGRASDIDPDNARVRNIFIEIRSEYIATIQAALQKDVQEAERLIKEIDGLWQQDDKISGLRNVIDRKGTIQRLLESAEKYLRENKLTLGSENAMSKFHEVLVLEPDNDRANTGIAEIEARLVQLVLNSLDDRSFNSARRHLRSLVSLSPNHPEADYLEQKILEAQSAPPPVPAVAAAEVNREERTMREQTKSLVLDQEDSLWQSVKDSCREGDLRSYLKTYPRGRHKDEAWEKLSDCSKQSVVEKSR